MMFLYSQFPSRNGSTVTKEKHRSRTTRMKSTPVCVMILQPNEDDKDGTGEGKD
jgi:hypothetical protein